MWEALREWTIDNPFFRLEWRRWLRRAGPWQFLGGNVATLSIFLLAFHVLYVTASPFGKAFFRPFSPAIFTVLALVHFFKWMSSGVPNFELGAEAREHRLQFIRLLPGDPRTLLLRIGAARSLIRALVLFAPLPVYLILTWYGQPPLDDIRALFLLLMLVLFGAPSPTEVTTALRTAEGWIAPGLESPTAAASETVQPAQNARPERAFLKPLLILAGVTAGLALVLALAAAEPYAVAQLVDGLSRVISQFTNKNFVAIFVLWIGDPRPFYRGELAPLWVITVFWVVRGVIRSEEAGELWARGLDLPLAAAAGEKADHEKAAVQAEVESIHPASRTVRLYQQVALPLGTLLVLGFFWPWWFQSGRLGYWVGVSTAAGSLGALFVGLAALFTGVFFEGLRCAREAADEPIGKSIRGAAKTGGEALGVLVLFVLAVGLVGGVIPIRELLSLLPGLLAAAAAMTAFGWGWRVFRNRWLLGAAGPITVLLRGLVHALLWTATYLGPLMVLGGWMVHPLAHRIASLSPIYGLLLQFAPLRSGQVLPILDAAAAPLLVGLGLALLAITRKRPEEDPEIGTRDPLFAVLTRTAREWDNPLFSLALRKRTVLKEHLTARMLRMPLVILILSGAGVGFFLMQGTRRSGRTMAEVLEQSSGISPSLNEGAFLGLMAAVGTLGFCALFTSNWSTAVSGENVGSRHRQQKQDLRLSPLTDVEILRGTLWGSLVEPLPGQVTGPAVSLIWVLGAVAFGAGAYWLLVWLGAAATMTGIAWLTALDGFHTWSPKQRRSRLLSYLSATGPGVLMVALLGFPALIAIPETARHVPYGLPLLALISAGLTFAQIPPAYRQAERWVRESREADE